MTVQFANTNRNGMEHIALLVLTVGSKYLTLGRARSYDNLIQNNQLRTSIDMRLHVYQDISSKDQKICNKMSMYFGRNMNDGILVNPPRTIGSIIPKITSMKGGTGIEFENNSGNGIPPINIGSFIHFNKEK